MADTWRVSHVGPMQYPGARFGICLLTGAASCVLTFWALLVMSFGGHLAAGFAGLAGMIALAVLRAWWIARHGYRSSLGPPIAFALPPVILLLWIAFVVLFGV